MVPACRGAWQPTCTEFLQKSRKGLDLLYCRAGGPWCALKPGNCLCDRQVDDRVPLQAPQRALQAPPAPAACCATGIAACRTGIAACERGVVFRTAPRAPRRDAHRPQLTRYAARTVQGCGLSRRTRRQPREGARIEWCRRKLPYSHEGADGSSCHGHVHVTSSCRVWCRGLRPRWAPTSGSWKAARSSDGTTRRLPSRISERVSMRRSRLWLSVRPGREGGEVARTLG